MTQKRNTEYSTLFYFSFMDITRIRKYVLFSYKNAFNKNWAHQMTKQFLRKGTTRALSEEQGCFEILDYKIQMMPDYGIYEKLNFFLQTKTTLLNLQYLLIFGDKYIFSTHVVIICCFMLYNCKLFNTVAQYIFSYIEHVSKGRYETSPYFS